MALDLHELVNGKAGKLLLSISDDQYTHLAETFKEFQRRTGLIISQYSDLKLQNPTALLDVFRTQIDSATASERDALTALIPVLESARQREVALIFVGD